jgi:Holliday junction resolvase RusA-like endonuclease
MTPPVLILELPPPPTTNGLFASVGRRRIKSKRYRSWQKEAGWELQRQRCGCIGGPWEADIALPTDLRGDADNYAKPILDLLVAHGVVDDDRYCRRLTVAKAGTVGPVIVTITPAPQGHTDTRGNA